MLMAILSKNQSKAQVLQCSLAERSLSLNCMRESGSEQLYSMVVMTGPRQDLFWRLASWLWVPG